MCMGGSLRGFGLRIGSTDHFNTQLVITLKYSSIAGCYALQVVFQPAVSSLVVAW
jgi:hypothetical protein